MRFQRRIPGSLFVFNKHANLKDIALVKLSCNPIYLVSFQSCAGYQHSSYDILNLKFALTPYYWKTQSDDMASSELLQNIYEKLSQIINEIGTSS